MGSLREMAEDFYICTLCLETLEDSRTLPCLHSFCRPCLGQYIVKTKKDWSISCPVCDFQVDGSKQGLQLTSIEQWLETFIPNSFIVTLSKIKAARASEKACDICRQEHVLVEAINWCMDCLEMLCDDCYRVYRRSKASRDHDMVTVDALQNESLEKLIRPTARPFICPTHKDKSVIMVCVDCKMAVCETCVVLSHTKCRRLEQLDKVSPNLRYDMQEAKRRVDSCRQGAVTTGDGITEHLLNLTQSKDSALEEVRQLKDKLVDLLLKRGEKAITQIMAAYAQERDMLTQRKRACEVSNSALPKTGQFLDNLICYGNDADILKNFDTIFKHVNFLEKEQASSWHRVASTVLKFSPEKRASSVPEKHSSAWRNQT